MKNKRYKKIKSTVDIVTMLSNQSIPTLKYILAIGFAGTGNSTVSAIDVVAAATAVITVVATIK